MMLCVRVPCNTLQYYYSTTTALLQPSIHRTILYCIYTILHLYYNIYHTVLSAYYTTPLYTVAGYLIRRCDQTSLLLRGMCCCQLHITHYTLHTPRNAYTSVSIYTILYCNIIYYTVIYLYQYSQDISVFNTYTYKIYP